jgi:probable HAF family extracellular repeat protein
MSLTGSVGQVRRGILASLAFVVVPLLLLAAACDTGMESPSPKSPESAAFSSSSNHGDAGTQYSFDLFDPPGATRTAVQAINNLGSATGIYFEGGPGNPALSFVRSPSGTITTFAPKGAVYTVAFGINDFGVIVGYFGSADGHQHGFVRKPNGAIAQFDLPNPPAVDSNLAAINNFGVLLGGYDTGDILTGFSVLLRDGQAINLGEAPGSAPQQTFAVGLNDFDLIAGQFFDVAGNGHGFILRGKTYTVVDVPGATNTQLQGVNDLGQVAVTADAAPGCGFLYDVNAKTFDALPCVGIGSNVYAVNNRGQFAGLNFDSVDPDNVWHGFIATPVRDDE